MRRLLDYWSVILVFVLFFGFFSYTVARNITHALLRSRVERVHSEVRDIDTGVAVLLAAAGTNNARDFFLDERFATALDSLMDSGDLQRLDAATLVYTRAFQSLLTYGDDAISELAKTPEGRPIAAALNPAVVQQLGGEGEYSLTDPWGEPYCIYPAPWPEEWATQPEAQAVQVYIWSTGADRISNHALATPGDDICNWEPDQPWLEWYDSLSFMRSFAAMFF